VEFPSSTLFAPKPDAHVSCGKAASNCFKILCDFPQVEDERPKRQSLQMPWFEYIQSIESLFMRLAAC